VKMMAGRGRGAAAEVGAQGRAGEGHGAAGRARGVRSARDDLDGVHLRGRRQR
jgi:hypothetical protein